MPSTCVRYHDPLAVETPSGLCATCQTLFAASDTARPAAAAPSTVALPPDDAENRGTATHDPAVDFLITRTGGVAAPTATLPRLPEGYDPLEVLGNGGMGVVVRAWEREAERFVALKMLRAAAHGGRDRFAVEVRAVAGLRHPNVVRVLSLGLDQPEPFFTMDHCVGGSLQARLRDGEMPVADAVRLMVTVARAVHDLHAANVLHRDLKPSNVLLDADGTPKVADFGLAKRLDRNDDLTLTGQLLGTPEYMAPEQASVRSDLPLDARTDVYGLGATLYALLTVRPPFHDRDMLETVRMVLEDLPVPPRTHRPDVPPELEAVVLKCLEKDPVRRYQTAAELADDLERWQAGERTVARPEGVVRLALRRVRLTRDKAAVTGIAAAAVALTVSAAVWGRWAPPSSAGKVINPVPLPVLPLVAHEPTPIGAFPARLTHEDAREELRAGRKVVLVDAHGPSVPVTWGLGACDVAPVDDVPLTIKSRTATVMHLLPDPGLDRYLVRADIRQHMRQTVRTKGNVPTFSQVGLVIGHAKVAIKDSAYAHGLFTIGLSEALSSDSTQGLSTAALFLLERPLDPPYRSRRAAASLLFSAPPTPHSFRSIEVAVTPDQVIVRHDGQEATTLASDVRSHWTVSAAKSGAMPPNASFPVWHPRLPLGLWVDESWAAVHSVTIEPLPQP